MVYILFIILQSQSQETVRDPRICSIELNLLDILNKQNVIRYNLRLQ